MQLSIKFFLALVCVIVLLEIVDCKHQTGTVSSKNSADNWIPVSRFWFGKSSQYGATPPTYFKWSSNKNVTYINGTLSSSIRLLIYDDQPDRWGAAKGNGLSCLEKSELANDFSSQLTITNGQFNLNESYARHWYIVIADCSGAPIDVSYDFWFMNVGGEHNKQFSMDEQGFWGIFLSFFLFFMALMFAQCFTSFMLFRSTSFHLVVKLLTASIILQFWGYMFGLVHYDQYARNGVGSNGSHFFGEMLIFTAHWMFIIMLILIARGVNESYFFNQRRNVIIAIVVLFLLDVIMFIWRAVIQHQILSPPFVYGTAPGVLLLIIRSIVGAYFIVLMRFSYVEEGNPERRSFLFRFGILGSVWLFFLPFIVIMVTAFLVKSEVAYAMDRSVAGFWYTLNFLVLCSFTFFFYWPSRIGNVFDFSKADVLIGQSSSTSPYETL